MSLGAIRGDRPLGIGDTDRLGYADVAKRIAVSLADRASAEGIVVGLEGKWGSGKSSLLHLIELELSQLPIDRQPSVINFRPWLIGNRDSLLTNLFSALSGEIDRVELAAGDATGVSKTKAKAAAEALRAFASGLGRTGAAIEIFGDATGFVPLKWAGKGLTALRDLAKGKPPEPPLSELKEKLTKALKELGHRFIITIDDVDRLEPAEAIEVLRLTRSVADFPNVTYLLCYDHGVLAESIEQAAGVQDGEAFLEKIIQLTIMVPLPEPFRLRQWFGTALAEFASTDTGDQSSRLKTVIDYEGGRQLTTPRSVIRALDSIRFLWPAIKNAGGDLADLVWLQLIKNGNAAQYRWIEAYCATAALMSIGTVRIDEAEKGRQVNSLLDTVDEDHFADLNYRYYFAEQLPGAECDFAEDGNGFELFQIVEDAERDQAIRDRRIASPDHYRLYFALSGPDHALTQQDFEQFWQATDKGPEAISEVLIELHKVALPGGIGKADMLLERLKAVQSPPLDNARSANLLSGFAVGMDAAFDARRFSIGWSTTLWDRAKRLIPKLLQNLDDDERSDSIRSMFQDGAAIGWLTSVMRREMAAHGRAGGRKKPQSDWLLTDGQLDVISDIMLRRYRAMSAAEILATVEPLDVLFCWLQSGDQEGPRSAISKCIEDDGGLVEALEKMTTVRSTSDRGTYSVLTRNNISPFVDFDLARARMAQLAASDGPLAGRARQLANAFDDDDRI